jgi:hypothetical protein
VASYHDGGESGTRNVRVIYELELVRMGIFVALQMQSGYAQCSILTASADVVMV